MNTKTAQNRLGDFGEQLKQSTKQQLDPKKTAKSIGQQIKGGSKSGLPQGALTSAEKSGNGEKSKRATEGLLGLQSVDEKQLNEMKQQDILDRKKGLKKTRQELARMLIRRHQEIQQEYKKAEEQREQKERGGQELPTYIRGKAGAPDTVEEQEKMVEEAENNQEEANQSIELPSSGKSSGPMRGNANKKKTNTEKRQWKKG